MCAILALSCCFAAAARAQDTAPPADQGKKQAAPKPPTPWFDKEEDTFPLPADAKHRADLERDVKEGRQEAEEVMRAEPPSTNMAYQERVERIGQILAHISNHMHAVALWGDHRHNVFHYHFVVLKGTDPNAFSLPGGYIFVYEGLMKFIESDDELAGVLAHEISHASFRHVATLEADANKASIAEIPVIIGSILAGHPEGVLAPVLVGAAFQSGWSIRAEEAADYGGFQLMCNSPYSPVAMLTFMERLAKEDQFEDSIVRQTIWQTHPVTPDRVQAFIKELTQANIPIERSKASPDYRVLLKNQDDGTVEATFDGIHLYTFAGDNAKTRAENTAERLNHCFDSVPEMYQVTEDRSDLAIKWKGEDLLTVASADAETSHLQPDKLLDRTLSLVKQCIFNLGYRVWTGPVY